MRVISFALVAVLLFIAEVRSQTVLDTIRGEWKSGSYQHVLDRLFEYRELAYGKTAEVDYMIATSACRLPGMEKWGSQFFHWILNYYNLETANRQRIQNEMNMCASNIAPQAVNFSSRWSTMGSAGVSGKAYYWLNSENSALSNNPVKVIRELSYEELNRRLFPPGQGDSAAAATRERVGSTYKIQSSGPFVVATSGHQSAGAIDTMISALTLYMNFYQRKYHIPAVSHLITMYLVPEQASLRQLAGKIHGIEVNQASIGYSFRDDMSIVGVIPGNIYGTLAHELFHLMARNNFGDIPPWLDEGNAALYEVSRVSGDSVYGIPNWRGAVLQQFWELRPTVDSLVRMNWQAFDNAPGDFEARGQAANHATARYFILYLQQTGRLFDIYEAFRKRSVTKSEQLPADESAALVESVLGKPLSVVDNEFAGWFKSLKH